MELFTSTLAEVDEEPLEASEDPLTWAEVAVFASVWRASDTAFFSVAAVVCAALWAVEAVVAFAWLAALVATAEDACSALLTEGVFKDAAEVR